MTKDKKGFKEAMGEILDRETFSMDIKDAVYVGVLSLACGIACEIVPNNPGLLGGAVICATYFAGKARERANIRKQLDNLHL